MTAKIASKSGTALSRSCPMAKWAASSAKQCRSCGKTITAAPYFSSRSGLRPSLPKIKMSRWTHFPEFRLQNRKRVIPLLPSGILSGFSFLRFSYFSRLLVFSFVSFLVSADRPAPGAAEECGWEAPGTAAVRGVAEAPGAAGVAEDLEASAEDRSEAAVRAGAGELRSGG